MNYHLALDILAWGASLAVLIRGLCVLNHMTPRSRVSFKIVIALLTISSFVAVIGPLYGAWIANAAHASMLVLIVLTCALDKRRPLGPRNGL